MRLKKRTGTTLIEILVVIVVFLVGILALVQVFPPGLTTLKNTSNIISARALADNEVERLNSHQSEIPDYISVGQHVNTPSGLQFFADPSLPTRELMPPKDPNPAPGQIDTNGDVLLNGGATVLGDWMLTSASNRISRVLGESHTVTAPQTVGPVYGSMFQLNYAPIYYFLLPSGVGEPGVLQVYGNEMARRFGDRKTANPIPVTFSPARDWEFFFVDRDKSDPLGPFTGQDQIWLGPATAKDVRIAMTFTYQGAVGLQQYDSVLVVSLDPLAPPPFATVVDNYWVISLPQLVGQPDVFGRVLYNPAQVLGVYRDSVRVQRLFQEVPVTAAFDPANPYQYKALNGNFGTVMVNPAAFNFEVRTETGRTVPLLANCDYTVYDWRILRDDFRVPAVPGDVKLVLGGIKPLNQLGADGRPYNGIGIAGPALDNTGAPVVRPDDFLLLDLATGGIILGNMADATHVSNGYHVDKTRGYIQFRNIGGPPGAIQVEEAFATGDPLNPWVAASVNVAGHAVRAMFQARGEWSVQIYRSAARYRETDVVAANGLQVAEYYVGGSSTAGGRNTVGLGSRLYFPMADLGQRVNVAEIWYHDSTGALRTIFDQNLLISGVENIVGVDLAYADLRPLIDPGNTGIPGFDYAMGYAVKRVRGASITVRVLNNSAFFNLTSDPVENYNRLEVWSRSWRRHETETYVLGGAN